MKTEIQFGAIYLFSSPLGNVYFSRCVIETFHTATSKFRWHSLLPVPEATVGGVIFVLFFFTMKHFDVVHTVRGSPTDAASLIWLRAHAASFAYKLAWKLEQVRLVYGDECSSNSRGKDVGSAVIAHKSGEREL